MGSTRLLATPAMANVVQSDGNTNISGLAIHCMHGQGFTFEPILIHTNALFSLIPSLKSNYFAYSKEPKKASSSKAVEPFAVLSATF
jgi:hypothetical protein